MSSTGSSSSEEEDDELDPKLLQTGQTYLIAPQDYVHIYGRKDGIFLGDKKANNEAELEKIEKKQPELEYSSAVSSRKGRKQKKKRRKHRKAKQQNSSWTNCNSSSQTGRKFVVVHSQYKKSKSCCRSSRTHRKSLQLHINLIQNYQAMKSVKMISSRKKKSPESSKKIVKINNEPDPTWKIAPSDYVHIYKNTLKKQK